MSDFRTKLLGITALGVAMAGLSYGQANTVTATTVTAGPELTLRAEGETELVGDTQTTFTATNAAGTTIVNITVYATLSVPVTGKLVSGVTGVNVTSTLSIPLCGGVAAQSIQGTANGTTVTFAGISLPTSAGGTACTVTISDVRVNATGAGNPLVTESILLSYPANGTSANASGNPANPVSVGYILPSLSYGLPTGTFLFPFQTCVGGTSLTVPLSNPAVLSATPTFKLLVNELTAGAWRTQPGENDPVGPADSTQATQIALAFANVPSSATIYVPISVSTLGGTILNLAGTPTAFSTTIPYAGYTPTNNTVTITYATTFSTATTGTVSIPVYISFGKNSAAAQSTAITVLASYSPSAALTGPTGIVPTFAVSTATPTNLESIVNCATTLLFPYVTNASGFETGIAIVNTTTDNLGTIPGVPSAATPISGTCTVNFYPGGTATQPPAYTTPLIGVGGTTVGSVAAATLSAMSGATNFSGYAIASCPFPEAHGFAYIVDNFGTPSGTAEGFLAVVVPNGRGENGFGSSNITVVAGAGGGSVSTTTTGN